MAKTNPTTILLNSAEGNIQIEEREAGGVVKPGQLLAINSDEEFIAHPTAGGHHSRMFALEDSLQGKTIAQNYAEGDWVRAVVAKPGDTVYALLSGGENASVDEYLTSNGDGTLKVATSTDIRVARCKQAVNASDSNDVDERIKVEVI